MKSFPAVIYSNYFGRFHIRAKDNTCTVVEKKHYPCYFTPKLQQRDARSTTRVGIMLCFLFEYEYKVFEIEVVYILKILPTSIFQMETHPLLILFLNCFIEAVRKSMQFMHFFLNFYESRKISKFENVKCT